MIQVVFMVVAMPTRINHKTNDFPAK